MTTDVTNLESMEVLVPATLVAEYHGSSAAESSAISAAVGAALRTVQTFLLVNRIPAAGPPRVVYNEWSPAGVKFTAGLPIAAVPRNVSDSADVSIRTTAECTALRFVHRGPYSDVRHTYDRIEAWLRARGGIKTADDWARYSPMWEEYLNDPATTPESDLVTRIYLTLS
jgi:effector-binding domain-containing protein